MHADELELDPRNEDFTWPVARAGGPISQDLAERWDEQGYLVLRSVLDPRMLADLTIELDALEAAHTARLTQAASSGIDINDREAITFTPHAVLHSASARAFARSGLFADLAAALVGPDVRLYWDQTVYKKPEPERVFPWHQDTGYAFTEPQHYLTCWVPLVDATVRNGCPEVVAGVHRRGTFAHRWTATGFECLPPDTVGWPAELAVGDLVCFSSLTPHRTGPNRTSEVRKAYILQFAADGSVCRAFGSDVAELQNDPDRQPLITRNGRAAGRDLLSRS